MPYKTQKQQNDYVREIWYPQNREKQLRAVAQTKARYNTWLDSLKNQPCHDCNQSFPPYVMDWDHLDAASKNFDISNGRKRQYNRQRILNEIGKCQLVCANCHRIRTHNRLQPSNLSDRM